MSPTRRDDWIDDDEYPDDADVADFGESSPPDFDPLTIGYVGDRRPFWARARIGLIVLAAIILTALLLPYLLPLFRG